MGSPAAARQMLQGWVTQHKENFDPTGTYNLDTTVAHGLKIELVEPGRVVCSFMVTQRVSNEYGGLHGGCFTVLVDTVSSAALSSVTDKNGVSLNISVDYYRPMPMGEELEIDAKVVKVGKTIAVSTVDFRRRSSGALVAQGKHVEHIGGTPEVVPKASATPRLESKL